MKTPRHSATQESTSISHSGPDAPGTVARFSGSLADLPVADLIQILQLAGKSAAITLSHGGGSSQLWCSAGSIIDAESGRLRGEAAVYRMLALERGWLSAELRSTPRERSIFAAPARLLLEAARRKDESVALRDKLGDVERCFRIAEGVDLELLGANALEACLLRSFATGRCLREALESSDLGDFETLTALAGWIEARALVETVAPRAPDIAERPPSGASHSSASQTPTATLVPLVASVRPPAATPPARARATSGSLTAEARNYWRWGALAALVLLPCGYLAGSRAARVLAPRANAGESAVAPTTAAVSGRAASDRDTDTVIDLRVIPAHAEITLDGSLAATGHCQTSLPRDGRTHELRVTAAGHLPTTILFVDAAPPHEIRLEPLPVPALERPAATPVVDATGVKPSVIEVLGAAPKARARPPLARAAVRREPARTLPRARSRVVETVLSVANPPRVQATEHVDPSMHGLD